MPIEGKEPTRYYWDACVFLYVIDANPNHMPILKAMLEDCDKGEIEIYTSTLSITEVAFAQAEKDIQFLDPAIEEKIDKLWFPPSPIKLVEIHTFITFKAKILIRNAVTRGWSLKPADAIHLATAQDADIFECHTYDNEWLDKYFKLVTYKITQPHTTTPFLPLKNEG